MRNEKGQFMKGHQSEWRFKKGHQSGMKGKKHTEETKRKIRNILFGRINGPLSEETKEKIRQKNILQGLNNDLIIKSYSEGKSAKDISDIFGCSKTPIYRILKERGITIVGVGRRKGYKNSKKGKTLEEFYGQERALKIKSKIKKTMSKLSDKDKKDIAESYRNGELLESIKKRYKISLYTIHPILKENNLEIKHFRQNKRFKAIKEQSKLIQLFESGKSIKELRDIYGCGENVILRVLNENNIPHRGRHTKRPNKEEIDKILYLYNEELKSVASISKIIHRRPCIISEVLKKNNKENGISINCNPKGHFMKGRTFEEYYGYKKSKFLKERFKKSRSKIICPIRDTKIEQKIQNFLTRLHIEYFTHRYMNIGHAYQCDIFIPIQEGIPQKTIIEADGDYFHANPKKYNENFKMFKNGMTAQERWNLDRIRTKELQEKGYRVIRLWEADIKKLDKESFNQILNET